MKKNSIVVLLLVGWVALGCSSRLPAQEKLRLQAQLLQQHITIAKESGLTGGVFIAVCDAVERDRLRDPPPSLLDTLKDSGIVCSPASSAVTNSFGRVINGTVFFCGIAEYEPAKYAFQVGSHSSPLEGIGTSGTITRKWSGWHAIATGVWER